MNTLYSKFQRLKANSVMSCSQNALKSLEKRSNFVLEKSEKPQSDFCTNPATNTATMYSLFIWFYVTSFSCYFNCFVLHCIA